MCRRSIRLAVMAGAFLTVQKSLYGEDMLLASLTLDDFVRQAQERGVRGRTTALTLESAGYAREAQLRQTSSPNLTLRHAHERAGHEVNGSETRTETKNSEVRLRQPTLLGTQIEAAAGRGDSGKPTLEATVAQPVYLFTWNASLRTRRRAELDFADAVDTERAARLSVMAEARSFYYDVVLGEETIQVEQRKANAAQALVEVTQALVQTGKRPPVETMRAKVRAQTDQRQLQNAIVARDRAVLNAKDYIAYPLEEPLQFSSRLSFRPFSITLDRLIETALSRRPELGLRRRAQEAARLNWQEAQEPARPELALESSWNSTELSPILRRDWTLRGVAQWQFFDSFVTRRKVKQAAIARWVADLNFSEVERQTRVNVRNAYLEVKRSEKQIQEFQFSRDQARRNVEVLRLRFQNGLERLIDVFDAESEMRNLDNEYLSLLVSFHRAKDTLSQTVGDDVETLR